MYHILGDLELKNLVMAEIEGLILAPSTSPSGSSEGQEHRGNRDVTVDISLVHDKCPHLMAVWYELLRLRVEFLIARWVHEDTTVCGNNGKGEVKNGASTPLLFRAGRLVAAPLRLHHYDEDVWGSEPEVFHYSRFLVVDNKGGGGGGGGGTTLDRARIRMVRAFGIPGLLLCPGRYLAFAITMATLVRALLTFEVGAIEGKSDDGKLEVPRVKHVDLPVIAEPEEEPVVELRRREDVGEVRILFGNLGQAW